MTGVADLVRTTLKAAWHTTAAAGALAALDAWLYLLLPRGAAAWAVPRLLPGWHADLRRSAMAHGQCPRPRLPDPRPTLALLERRGAGGGSTDGADGAAVEGGASVAVPRRWGILLPVTSRGAADADAEAGAEVEDAPAPGFGEAAFTRLERNAALLVESVPPERRSTTTVYVAVDLHDPVYDSDDARRRLEALFAPLTVEVLPPLVPAYQGAVCWIWALLAKHAAAAGAELLVLLGDDVELLDNAWQEDVEARFEEVAIERGLPFGCACVAIRDRSYEVFPTFPVIHRDHLEAFDGELFPKEFRNQHGDPYLYELYRRWGAARYTRNASLRNAVGGKGAARYNKEGGAAAQWREQLLDKGIDILCRWIQIAAPAAKRVPCIDVVVPTFRCDRQMLAALASLPCNRDASVHTIIVCDRPDADNLDEVQRLLSYTPNRTVRVHVMEENAGASFARNAGLHQSFGDHAVLLDDDVMPQAGLLDAYLGAIERHPGAAAYVGVTELPAPITPLQHALTACRICYFYGVADQQKHPPWGVTANLCVPSRHSSVSFSSRFPKHGGGEDVHFCIRAQAAGFGRCVAVPGARVLHPFWERPLKQVAGWARGDVLCLDALPHLSFRAVPNWAEAALACLLLKRPHLAALAIVVEVAMLTPRFWGHAMPKSPPWRLAAAAAGALPPMLQDTVRLGSKLHRLRLSQLCMHFDWMNGAGHHVMEKQLDLLGKFIAFLLAAVAIEAAGTTQIIATVGLASLYTTWIVGQAGLRVLPKPPPLRLALDSCRLGPDALNLGAAKVPFVIFGHQRTGSNLLCGYLWRHPSITMHYEVYNDKVSARGWCFEPRKMKYLAGQR